MALSSSWDPSSLNEDDMIILTDDESRKTSPNKPSTRGSQNENVLPTTSSSRRLTIAGRENSNEQLENDEDSNANNNIPQPQSVENSRSDSNEETEGNFSMANQSEEMADNSKKPSRKKLQTESARPLKNNEKSKSNGDEAETTQTDYDTSGRFNKQSKNKNTYFSLKAVLCSLLLF
jgi:hypothetical protein